MSFSAVSGGRPRAKSGDWLLRGPEMGNFRESEFVLVILGMDMG